MPSTTTNYGLHIYNSNTDGTSTFASFRDNLAGIGTNSNMYIIDGKLKEWKDLIDASSLKNGIINVPISYEGANTYSATGITSITSYTTGLALDIVPDTSNDGTTILNINSLGNKYLYKYDSSGSTINLDIGDLVIGHHYLYVYNGIAFIWVNATSAGQIYTTGTVGDFVKINTDNTLVDSGLSLDTDGTLAGNSNVKLPSQQAVKTYVDTAVTGLLDFKGSTSCSGNPNYPSASKGDAYIVSVAGKIGGSGGKVVEIGDVYLATADNEGGTEAVVGTSWAVLEHNLTGALLTANNLSELTATGSTARTNLGLAIGTDVMAQVTPSTSGNVLTSNGAGAWTSTTPAVDLTNSVTLTNKTLTSPKINEAVALTTTATKLNYLTSATGTTGTTSTNVVFSTSPALTTPTITNPTVTNYVETLYTATGSSFTVDLTNGTLQKFTTDNACTITLPASVAGKSYTIMVAYGGTHTLTWAGGGTLKWSGGTAPTATSVSGKIDFYVFACDGTNTYGADGGRNY